MSYIMTVRGTLKEKDENAAKKLHDTLATQAKPLGASFGNVHHSPYLNPENPREFFDVDVWNDDLPGLQKFLADPNMAKVFGQMFEGMPEVRIWSDKGWMRW